MCVSSGSPNNVATFRTEVTDYFWHIYKIAKSDLYPSGKAHKCMNRCSLNLAGLNNVFIVNKLANTVNTKCAIVVLAISCN